MCLNAPTLRLIRSDRKRTFLIADKPAGRAEESTRSCTAQMTIENNQGRLGDAAPIKEED
ncbi:hypothetical protein RRH01S_29_00550 [Rhizobium rhizogenes NBRC 13257]|uniref:Uncharacterized protein n=1 Tax=Rhizobium rhizogenes NBRC 13257 TaxID=1220581 RepID=A0AA87QGX9_RHIRH|nr:hypothetical protein RRH01S_29_00550 [Rhizobium rhizogenes NBRC 13257]